MTHDQSNWYREWKGWSAEAFGKAVPDEACFRAELVRSGITTLAGLDVLELGFGNGGFARWARGAGARYCGTELDDALVQRASEAGIRAFPARDFPECLPGSDRFDLIVAWDVLEHVPRPGLLPMLAELRRRVSAHGVLVARMPSGDSPFARAIQYGDVTHEPPIGSCAIRMLASRAGFSRVETRPASLPVWGAGLRSACRRLAIRSIDMAARPVLAALMRNPGAITTPNMILSARP
jgi:SAM-dependent methyltransferase